MKPYALIPLAVGAFEAALTADAPDWRAAAKLLDLVQPPPDAETDAEAVAANQASRRAATRLARLIGNEWDEP